MIKKIAAVVLATAIVISLYSCFGNGSDKNLESSDTSVTSVDTEGVVGKNEMYKVEVRKERISTDTYDADMTYPVIEGYSDSEIEEKVNALVRTYVDKRILESVSGANEENRAYFKTTSFDVTCRGEHFFSVRIHGSVTYDLSDLSEENIAFGINADLANANLVPFSEIADYEKFVADFKAGAYLPTPEFEKILDDTTYDDLIGQYGELYSIYPEFYLKSDSGSGRFGIIIETVGLLGGFAEFEAPIDGRDYFNNTLLEAAGLAASK